MLGFSQLLKISQFRKFCEIVSQILRICPEFRIEDPLKYERIFPYSNFKYALLSIYNTKRLILVQSKPERQTGTQPYHLNSYYNVEYSKLCKPLLLKNCDKQSCMRVGIIRVFI
ncbi:unnamed protein product [Moneuplotes crassus]|uniref:Uncharacterized protein n=1 Tax=Euplotes crassus TaxID=5936 RepID=A0AAD1Y7A0_EUPCR|nr:unnamed protein product [Moneuplotes crassus]